MLPIGGCNGSCGGTYCRPPDLHLSMLVSCGQPHRQRRFTGLWPKPCMTAIVCYMVRSTVELDMAVAQAFHDCYHLVYGKIFGCIAESNFDKVRHPDPVDCTIPPSDQHCCVQVLAFTRNPLGHRHLKGSCYWCCCSAG